MDAFHTFPIFSLLAAAILTLAAPCHGSSNTETSPVAIREQLRATYKALVAGRRREKWDPEEEGGLETRLRELTTHYILLRLNSDDPPTPEVFDQELNETLAYTIMARSIQELLRFRSEARFASVLASSDPSMNLYVIGYELGLAGNAIQGFSHTPEGYRLVAEGGQELQRHKLRLVQLKSFDTEEIRFLAFGKRIGATGSNISVVVYRFDGETITPLWGRQLLPQGKVALKDDEVVLEYLDRERSEKRTPPYLVVEIYEQTKEGLKLLRSQP